MGRHGKALGGKRGGMQKARGTQEERQKALALVAEGRPYREIARILGRSPETIRRWIMASPEEARELHEQYARTFAMAAWEVAFEGLARLLEGIRRVSMDDADARELREFATALGITIDKALAAMGRPDQATDRKVVEVTRKEARIVVEVKDPNIANTIRDRLRDRGLPVVVPDQDQESVDA